MIEQHTGAYLFTDVVGSTRLWEDFPTEMSDALARHDRIARTLLARHNGRVFSTAGDSFAAAFDTAEAAVLAATEFQQALSSEPWPQPAVIQVRMGIHIGETQQRQGGFYGAVLNRAARLMSAAHGGQLVLSNAAREVCREIDWLASEQFVDLGEHRLKDLSASEHIWQLNIAGLSTEFDPLVTLNPKTTNLPVQLTEFIGRESDRAQLADHLQTGRLVTIHGLGGMGKTRLAIQVGGDVAAKFHDGLWFVELAPLREPEAVPFALAEVLGVVVGGAMSPTEAAASSLGDQHALIILDNCEHVAAATQEMVRTLLLRCPNVTVLATSRVNLGVAGEVLYNLQPMAGGSDDAPAVELFVQRATAANPSLRFDTTRYKLVADLCDQLDRMPLAIELAAARCRSMTPEDIAQNLHARFKLLTTKSGVEDRHRRLIDTLDWSYRQLSPEAQLLFNRLSVFVGMVSLDATTSVCGDDELDDFAMIDTIEELLDHSMVTADMSGPRVRYQLLETLREFGAGQLGQESTPWQQRHCDYHAQLVARIAADTMTAGEADAWLELDEIWDDLRAASIFARSTMQANVAADLVSHLAAASLWRSRLESSRWAQATIDLEHFDGLAPLTRIGVLGTAAAGLMHGEGAVRAKQFVDQAAELATQVVATEADTRVVSISSIFFFLGALDDGIAYAHMAHAHFEDPKVKTCLLVSASQMHSYSGSKADALATVQQALDASTQVPEMPVTWQGLLDWGHLRHSSTSPAPVLAQLPEFIDRFTQVGNPFVAASAHRHLVSLQAANLDLAEFLKENAQALQAVDLSDPRNATGWILLAATGLLKAGSYYDAALLLAWQERYRVAPIQPDRQAQIDEHLPAMFESLGANALQAAATELDELSFTELVQQSASVMLSVAETLVLS